MKRAILLVLCGALLCYLTLRVPAAVRDGTCFHHGPEYLQSWKIRRFSSLSGQIRAWQITVPCQDPDSGEWGQRILAEHADLDLALLQALLGWLPSD